MVSKLYLTIVFVAAVGLAVLLFEINREINDRNDFAYAGLVAACFHQNDIYVELNLLTERMDRFVRLQAKQSVYSAYFNEYQKLLDDLKNIPIPNCEDLVVRP